MRSSLAVTAAAITILSFGACSAATTGTELANLPCNSKLIAGILSSPEQTTASESAYLKRCGVEQHAR